jgi:hypothetical protein
MIGILKSGLPVNAIVYQDRYTFGIETFGKVLGSVVPGSIGNFRGKKLTDFVVVNIEGNVQIILEGLYLRIKQIIL